MLGKVVRKVVFVSEVELADVPVAHDRHILDQLHRAGNYLVNVPVSEAVRCLRVLLPIFLLFFFAIDIHKLVALLKTGPKHELVPLVPTYIQIAAAVAEYNLPARFQTRTFAICHV